jgi:hypothetical protein
MKLKIFLFASTLLFCFEAYVLSQQNEAESSKTSGLIIGLSAGPAYSGVINEGNSSLTGLVSKHKSSLTGSLDVLYMFSEHIGLSSGIRLITFNSELSLSTYHSTFIAIDSENDNYEYRILATGMDEIQKIKTFNIPLCIMLRLPLNKKTAFFLQPGLSLMIPVVSNYKSTGTFTYKGYYPAYDILLENLPAYGFPTSKDTNSEGELNLKKTGLGAVASAGLDFSIGSKLQIAVAGSFYRSVSSISRYTNPENFQLSTEVNQINSLTGGSSEVLMRSYGITMSLRYQLR